MGFYAPPLHASVLDQLADVFQVELEGLPDGGRHASALLLLLAQGPASHWGKTMLTIQPDNWEVSSACTPTPPTAVSEKEMPHTCLRGATDGGW